MKSVKNILAVAALAAALPLAYTNATVIDQTVAEEGFVKNYTGSTKGDMDIRSASVVFDGTNFILSATMDDVIGSTTGVTYVWGFDRGGATAHPFDRLDNGNVIFDAAVRVNGNTGDVTSNQPGINGTKASISDKTFTTSISAALLPATKEGTAFGDYFWNLWSVSSGTIADFAPNNKMERVGVPEPASLGLMGLGVTALGFLYRRRQNLAA